MATKLYPPLIEGTIPAFTTQYKDNGTTTNIVVPFSLNRAVSVSEIAGFALIIKTVQGTLLQSLTTSTNNWDRKNMTVTFSFPEDKLTSLQLGQFYKIQLAFQSKSTIYTGLVTGYYSTVGIIKYTSTPTLQVNDLKNIESNPHQYSYTLLYSQQDKDSSEKLYQSRFVLTDSSSNIIEDSDWIIHNVNLDKHSYESQETFVISRDLNMGESYYLTVYIETINGVSKSTYSYRLHQTAAVKSLLNGYLRAKANFDDGYVSVNLVGYKNANGIESRCNGNFVLSRAAENDNYVWHDIYSFSLSDAVTSRELWKDFTVEQGVKYLYALQEENLRIRSARIVSNEVQADFEDAFLYDGERQLKIRFNPKVTNFKTDLQESKVETLGKKYPFIFRNSKVYYKEFPVSGLISYKMDENEFFLTKEDIRLEKEMLAPNESFYHETFDLVSNNIMAERNFKLNVMEWLNNGEIKLFRSPGEGNFIVRLMNVSLSPIDTLGRMLHSFQCTAYEISDFTFDNLTGYNFLRNVIYDITIDQWVTVQLTSHSKELDSLLNSIETYIRARVPIVLTQEQYSRIKNGIPKFQATDNNGKSLYFAPYGNNSWALLTSALKIPDDLNALRELVGKVTSVSGQLNTSPVYSIDIRDMTPGTLVAIQTEINGDLTYIQIGPNGAYSAKFDDPIYGIIIPEEQTNNVVLSQGMKGSITYNYKSIVYNTFSLIDNFYSEDVPCRQWVGVPSKKIQEINDGNIASRTTHNVIEIIEDAKTDVSNISAMKFWLRPIKQVFMQDRSKEDHSILEVDVKSPLVDLYWDMDCTQKVDINNEFDNYYMYAVCHNRFDYTYQEVPFESYYIDANFRQDYYVDNTGKKFPVFADLYLDGASTDTKRIVYNKNAYNTTITIDDDIIDLYTVERYSIQQYNQVPRYLTFGNGVVGEITYNIAVKEYSFETTDSMVDAARHLYLSSVTSLKKFLEYMSVRHISSTDASAYALLLGDNLTGMSWPPTTEKQAEDIEAKLIANIKENYENYVYLVQTTLYSYEKESES